MSFFNLKDEMNYGFTCTIQLFMTERRKQNILFVIMKPSIISQLNVNSYIWSHKFPNISAAENRKILHEQETEKMLIHLLSHDSPDVQTAAAQALAIMAENLISRDSVREWGKLISIHIYIIYDLS